MNIPATIAIFQKVELSCGLDTVLAALDSAAGVDISKEDISDALNTGMFTIKKTGSGKMSGNVYINIEMVGDNNYLFDEAHITKSAFTLSIGSMTSRPALFQIKDGSAVITFILDIEELKTQDEGFPGSVFGSGSKYVIIAAAAVIEAEAVTEVAVKMKNKNKA